MTEPLRIVSIGAHPADIFDQSGGTMAHHTSRGDYVACVVLTHGARVHDAVISDAMFHREEVPDQAELMKLMEDRSDVKAEEVRAACNIVGAKDIYFFGADDAVLPRHGRHGQTPSEIVSRVAARCRVDPFSQRKRRAHQLARHHRTNRNARNLTRCSAWIQVIGILRIAWRRSIFFGTGAAAVPANVWRSEGGFYNDVFIDITDVVDKKTGGSGLLGKPGVQWSLRPQAD